MRPWRSVRTQLPSSSTWLTSPVSARFASSKRRPPMISPVLSMRPTFPPSRTSYEAIVPMAQVPRSQRHHQLAVCVDGATQSRSGEYGIGHTDHGALVVQRLHVREPWLDLPGAICAEQAKCSAISAGPDQPLIDIEQPHGELGAAIHPDRMESRPKSEYSSNGKMTSTSSSCMPPSYSDFANEYQVVGKRDRTAKLRFEHQIAAAIDHARAPLHQNFCQSMVKGADRSKRGE